MMHCPPVLAISTKALPSQFGHADWHWRIARPFARLAELGVDTATCWLDAADRPTVSPAGRIVILQRVVKSGTQAEVTAWVQSLRDTGALSVIFEIDDDEISEAVIEWMDAAGGLESVARAKLEAERMGLLWTMQACDAVTVSTEPLAEVVRRYTDAPVYVVPNAIDVDWFRERLGTRVPWAEHVTIGWAGGRRPDADLEPMAAAWGRIAERYPDVRFVVAGWQPDVIYQHVDDQRIIRLPWQAIDEYPQAMQVDIGCTPLSDTPFNRCKSPIKAWEYALAGAVLVASRTVYADCALNGGHTPATDADNWEQRLSAFIGSETSRHMSNWGMSLHVEWDHRLTSNLHRWADVYSEIAARVGVRA